MSKDIKLKCCCGAEAFFEYNSYVGDERGPLGGYTHRQDAYDWQERHKNCPVKMEEYQNRLEGLVKSYESLFKKIEQMED